MSGIVEVFKRAPIFDGIPCGKFDLFVDLSLQVAYDALYIPILDVNAHYNPTLRVFALDLIRSLYDCYTS
ncbi:hypothetical protein D3C72_2350300 [compost metagenome]